LQKFGIRKVSYAEFILKNHQKKGFELNFTQLILSFIVKKLS